jgi:hypothetical protein
MAGYSGTPLPQKLGIKPGHVLGLVNEPSGFRKTLGVLPADVKVAKDPKAGGPYNVLVVFTTAQLDVARHIRTLKTKLDAAGGLWIAWPKRASGVATDVTEDSVRNVALAEGLVDNKVCAIDDTWSGLRLVYRLSDRPKLQASAKPTAARKTQAPTQAKSKAKARATPKAKLR